MESIEPIIRLVEYQLREVLPVNLALAGPSPSADPTVIYLPPPKQVCTSFHQVAKDRFPAIVIDVQTSLPVDAEQLLNCPEDATQAHTFNVFFVLAASERESDTLLYQAARWAQVVKDTLRGFDEAALLAAFTASRLDPVPLDFVAGAVDYTEDKRDTLLLRECLIGFTCYS